MVRARRVENERKEANELALPRSLFLELEVEARFVHSELEQEELMRRQLCSLVLLVACVASWRPPRVPPRPPRDCLFTAERHRMIALHARQQSRTRPKRPPSLTSRLQQVQTAADGLELFAFARTTDGTVDVLARLAMLMPRAIADRRNADRIRHDDKLVAALSQLATEARQCSVAKRGAALWSLGMLFPRGTDAHAASSAASASSAAAAAAAAALATALAPEEAAAELPAHEAAAALWGCEALNSALEGCAAPVVTPPPALVARAARLPFRLHVGAVEAALTCLGGDGHPINCEGRRADYETHPEGRAVASLAADLPLRRDVVASGSEGEDFAEDNLLPSPKRSDSLSEGLR